MRRKQTFSQELYGRIRICKVIACSIYHTVHVRDQESDFLYIGIGKILFLIGKSKFAYKFVIEQLISAGSSISRKKYGIVNK